MPANPTTQADTQFKAPRASEFVERRKSTRQPLGAVGLLSVDGDSEFKNQLEVLVLDVSLGGVGFRSPVAFRVGAVYALRIGSGPLHLKARLRIVSSRTRDDGMFDVGAKFI